MSDFHSRFDRIPHAQARYRFVRAKNYSYNRQPLEGDVTSEHIEGQLPDWFEKLDGLCGMDIIAVIPGPKSHCGTGKKAGKVSACLPISVKNKWYAVMAIESGLVSYTEMTLGICQLKTEKPPN